MAGDAAVSVQWWAPILAAVAVFVAVLAVAELVMGDLRTMEGPRG